MWDQLASALAKSGSIVSSEVIDTSGKAAAVGAASTKPADRASVGIASAAAAPAHGSKAAAVAKSAAAKKAATAPAAKPAAAQAAGPPEVDDLFAAAARVSAAATGYSLY